jgi:hypothetical protein
MIVGATAPKDRPKYAQDRPRQPRPCGFQREGVMPARLGLDREAKIERQERDSAAASILIDRLNASNDE